MNSVNLIFKIRGNKLVSYYTKINGKMYGIAEKIPVPKTKRKCLIKSILLLTWDGKSKQ